MGYMESECVSVWVSCARQICVARSVCFYVFLSFPCGTREPASGIRVTDVTLSLYARHIHLFQLRASIFANNSIAQ